MDESSGEEPSEVVGLITSDDEFNASFQQLEVEDSDRIYLEKTPPQSPQFALTQPGKHALTPESKAAAEKKPKRFAAYNLSHRQCDERRRSLSDELEHLLQYKEDSNAHVKQSVLLDLLNLKSEQKSILTRTIKATFPNASKKTIMINHQSMVVYTHLLFKPYVRHSMASKELFAEDSKDILVIQEQITEIEQRLVQDEENIVSALNINNVDLAKTLLTKHSLNLQQHFKLQTALVSLYEHKMQKIQRCYENNPISPFQKEQIVNEMKVMEDICFLGLKSGDVESVLDKNIFDDLVKHFNEKCPLLHSVLETLLVTDSRIRVKKTPKYKLTCGVNALALLLSVRNQKCKNDVRLLLGLVSISYGAGKQFINLLHAIGLTPHWDTLNNFLDKKLKTFPQTLSEKCPITTPVILLMDNINLYRGRRRHLRLFKPLGPSMWNFTGRAAMIPDLTGIEHLMSCRETATMPQRDIASIRADHLFLESMPEHKKLWNDWCDMYYLDLLEKSLNVIPTPPKPFVEMEEAELNSWLSKVDFEKPKDDHEQKFKVSAPKKQTLCKNAQVTKTDVINLPLSLEDNSTLNGTAAIYEEFGREFSIPCAKTYDIPFNPFAKKFDLIAARTQYDFMKSVEMHQNEMSEIEKRISSVEKELDGPTTTDLTLDSESDSGEDGETSEPVKNPNQQKDEKFAEFCTRITKQVQESAHSTDDFSLDNLVHQLSNDMKRIYSTTDKYKRTILHYAVEEKNYVLVKILLAVGVDPNCKEGCGATPMSLAVMNRDTNMCKILLDNFAECSGPLFGAFPTPINMATSMELTEIVDMFRRFEVSTNYPLISLLQKNNQDSTPQQSALDQTESVNSDISSQTESAFSYRRSVYEGFPTGIVGDVGTCKVNRSVKNRNGTAYGWSTEIPGDMHAKGHLCEAAFKAHGKGGFHKVVNDVMKRPKLTEEAFKKRKFQEQNLQHIQEAVRDGSYAYGIAAVYEFKASKEFPSDDDLKTALRKDGNHNEILLEKFKLWLHRSRGYDESHKYRQELFCVFGPLLDLFITAGREGDGVLRETAWVMLLPIFAQLDFRNYWTEAFVHVVNFTSLWPLAFRCMVKQNCSVNISGKRGHNLDMDEYVETYVVRPLKLYSTGHTSVQMCQRIMGNLNLLGSIRNVYSRPDSFNYHQTTKHKTQSSLPDVIKGMWFCLRNQFFKVSERGIAFELPLRSTDEVKKVLECGVCEDLFAFHGEKVPRLLLCGHTLCHECLTKLPLRNRNVVCPFDRQKTELSDSGVWGLKKNFALLELLERLKVTHAPLVNNFEEDENNVTCDENEEHLASVYCIVCGTHLCSSCSEITHATKTLNKHKRVPLSEKPLEKAVCSDHLARIIEFACAEDGCQNNPLMCVLCKDYGKHKGHKHHLVMTEAENVRSSISNAIQHIKLFTEDIAKATQKIETVIQKIEGSVVVEDDTEGQSHSRHVVGTGDMARVRVRDYFDDLRETVNRQEEAGLAVVDSYLRDQLSWLRQRQEDMVVLNSHTSAVCSHCEKTLKSDDSQVVASRSDILKVLQTVQEQQQQFLETAELYPSDGSIPIAFTKDNRVHIGPKMEMRVVALGLDGAGKTSILFKLKQDEFVSTITTIGFNVETIEHKNLKFTIWDVGGLHKLRPLWRHYYLNTQAVIFVVDSSNKERMEESHAELVKLMTEKRLSDSLLLVYANKQDLPTALDLDQITERLCLHKLCCGRSWSVIGCDAHSGRGLREGLDWLATQLMSEFPP